MKPHLYRKRGIWHCRFLKLPNATGLGLTPLTAYQDWLLMRGGYAT